MNFYLFMHFHIFHISPATNSSNWAKSLSFISPTSCRNIWCHVLASLQLHLSPLSNNSPLYAPLYISPFGLAWFYFHFSLFHLWPPSNTSLFYAPLYISFSAVTNSSNWAALAYVCHSNRAKSLSFIRDYRLILHLCMFFFNFTFRTCQILLSPFSISLLTTE